MLHAGRGSLDLRDAEVRLDGEISSAGPRDRRNLERGAVRPGPLPPGGEGDRVASDQKMTVKT